MRPLGLWSPTLRFLRHRRKKNRDKNHDAADRQGDAGLRGRFILFARRLNNTTDYNSNFQFIRHVLMMDSTFSGNRGMWRALNSPAWHTMFYLLIIAWEGTRASCGGRDTTCAHLARIRGNVQSGEDSCDCGSNPRHADVAGCVSDRRRRVVPDVAVKAVEWSGRSLFRMFTVIGVVLLLVAQPESEGQP